MITARMPGFAGLIGKMTAGAKALAAVRATATIASQRSSPARWRKAALLWPLFTKD